MPYIIAVHMKQATTVLLFVLPFTLVDALGAKMVPLMTLIAFIYIGRFILRAMVDDRYRRNSGTGRRAVWNVGQSIEDLRRS